MEEKQRTAVTKATTAPIAFLLDAKVQQIIDSSSIINQNLSSEQKEQLREEITDSLLAIKATEVANAMPCDSDLFISATKLMEMKNTEIPKLYDPIIPKGAIGILAGSSDTGKSMILRQLAICVTTGRDFLGFPFRGIHKAVIYAASEDNQEAVAFFLKQSNKHYNDPANNWQNLSFTFITDNIVENLDNRLSMHPCDLIIVDSLQDFFDGKDTSDSTQIRTFLNKFDALAKKYGCTIIFLHHISKGEEDNAPTKKALVGSQAIEAKARFVILLVSDRKDDSIRHFCLVKQNYLGSEYKRNSIDLKLDSETFTFNPTGQRTPLEQLGSTSDKKKESKAKGVNDYATDEEYQAFVSENVKEKISKTALLHKLKDVYSCRQDNAYDIFNYLVSNRWLEETKEKNKTYYQNACAF